jgi:hypothetical protein
MRSPHTTGPACRAAGTASQISTGSNAVPSQDVRAARSWPLVRVRSISPWQSRESYGRSPRHALAVLDEDLISRTWLLCPTGSSPAARSQSFIAVPVDALGLVGDHAVDRARRHEPRRRRGARVGRVVRAELEPLPTRHLRCGRRPRARRAAPAGANRTSSGRRAGRRARARGGLRRPRP